jgi:hypothetical protein
LCTYSWTALIPFHKIWPGKKHWHQYYGYPSTWATILNNYLKLIFSAIFHFGMIFTCFVEFHRIVCHWLFNVLTRYLFFSTFLFFFNFFLLFIHCSTFSSFFLKFFFPAPLVLADFLSVKIFCIFLYILHSAWYLTCLV